MTAHPVICEGQHFYLHMKTRSLVFCVEFCRSLFVLFLLTILLSILRFTDSDYLFCIFKLFLHDHIISLVGKVWVTLPSYWSACTKSGEKTLYFVEFLNLWIGWDMTSTKIGSPRIESISQQYNISQLKLRYNTRL